MQHFHLIKTATSQKESCADEYFPFKGKHPSIHPSAGGICLAPWAGGANSNLGTTDRFCWNIQYEIPFAHSSRPPAISHSRISRTAYFSRQTVA